VARAKSLLSSAVIAEFGALLKRRIRRRPLSMSPRIRQLRAILAKLQLPAPRPPSLAFCLTRKKIAKPPASGASSGSAMMVAANLEIFAGPDARRQALRCAMQKYAHFKEVQLEPYPSGGH
jgi:hypothetical protein